MDWKLLLGLIRKPGSSADELRSELDKMPAAITTAEDVADTLERERLTVLLEGTDKDLAEIEDRIVAANRQTERLCEAQKVLKRRLAEAEERERHDGLTNERDETEKETAAVVKQVAAEYPKAAQRIATMLQRLVDAEDAVERVNAKLAAVGRGDERLEGPEHRLFPKTDSANAHRRFWHLGGEVRLPYFSDGWSVGWGDVPPGTMDRGEREAA